MLHNGFHLRDIKLNSDSHVFEQRIYILETKRKFSNSHNHLPRT